MEVNKLNLEFQDFDEEKAEVQYDMAQNIYVKSYN